MADVTVNCNDNAKVRTEKAKLSFRQKLAYGIGDLGLTLPYGILSLMYMKFLTDFHLLEPLLVGSLISIVRVWDSVNDPIMGFLADRTKTKIGSYRPYLFWGAIPYALVFILMWWLPPGITGVTGKILYFCVMYFLLDTVDTIVFIPYAALTPRLTRDYDERTSLTTFRMVFSLSGTMLANTVPGGIIGTMKDANLRTILTVMAVAGLIASASFLITALGTKEIKVEKEQQTGFLETFKIAFSNKPFILAVTIYLTTIMSFDLMIGAFLYYFENTLMITDTMIPLALLFVFSLLSVALIWNRISTKYNKIKAYLIGATCIVVSQCAVFFLPRGTGSVAIYLIFALCGIGLGAGQTLPWAIVPDALDYTEYKTGKRADSAMYSFMTFSRKIGSALSPLIIGGVLSLGKYAVGVVFEPWSTTDISVRVIFSLVPALFMALGIIAAAKYPLTKDRSQKISAELKKRHKEARYEQ